MLSFFETNFLKIIRAFLKKNYGRIFIKKEGRSSNEIRTLRFKYSDKMKRLSGIFT